MSYDLIITSKSDDENWEEVLDRLETYVTEDRPLSESRRAEWVRLGKQLEKIGFAPSMGQGFVEFDLEEPPIQVSCFQDEIGVSVPYWFEGEAAAGVMRKVATVLEIVREATGWKVYDPQIDQQVDTVKDLLDDGAGVMSSTAVILDEMLSVDGSLDDESE